MQHEENRRIDRFRWGGPAKDFSLDRFSRMAFTNVAALSFLLLLCALTALANETNATRQTDVFYSTNWQALPGVMLPLSCSSNETLPLPGDVRAIRMRLTARRCSSHQSSPYLALSNPASLDYRDVDPSWVSSDAWGSAGALRNKSSALHRASKRVWVVCRLGEYDGWHCDDWYPILMDWRVQVDKATYECDSPFDLRTCGFVVRAFSQSRNARTYLLFHDTGLYLFLGILFMLLPVCALRIFLSDLWIGYALNKVEPNIDPVACNNPGIRIRRRFLVGWIVTLTLVELAMATGYYGWVARPLARQFRWDWSSWRVWAGTSVLPIVSVTFLPDVLHVALFRMWRVCGIASAVANPPASVPEA